MLSVASENHRFFAAEALGAEGLTGDIVLEPEGPNTAAAMALAAMLVSQERNDPCNFSARRIITSLTPKVFLSAV